MRATIERVSGMISAFLLAMPGVAWAVPDVPAPPQAETLTAREAMNVGGLQAEMSVYQSYLPAQEVQQFYERTLPSRGWNRTGAPFPITAAGPQAAQAPTGWQPSLPAAEGELYFEKRGQYVAIELEPEGYKTMVTVTLLNWRATPLPAATSARPAEPPAAPAGAHDPIGLPLYPDATRMMATGGRGDASFLRMYRSTDAPEDVLAFYRDAMAQAGWRLKDQQDRRQTIDVPPALRQSVPRDTAQALTDAEFRVHELDFRRAGEGCQVVVTHIPPMPGAQTGTMIALQWMRVPSWEGR